MFSRSQGTNILKIWQDNQPFLCSIFDWKSMSFNQVINNQSIYPTPNIKVADMTKQLELPLIVFLGMKRFIELRFEPYTFATRRRAYAQRVIFTDDVLSTFIHLWCKRTVLDIVVLQPGTRMDFCILNVLLSFTYKHLH